jgi:hypothetical protein
MDPLSITEGRSHQTHQTPRRAELPIFPIKYSNATMRKQDISDFIEINETDTPYFYHLQNDIQPLCEPRSQAKLSKNRIFDLDWNISKPGMLYRLIK